MNRTKSDGGAGLKRSEEGLLKEYSLLDNGGLFVILVVVHKAMSSVSKYKGDVMIAPPLLCILRPDVNKLHIPTQQASRDALRQCRRLAR